MAEFLLALTAFVLSHSVPARSGLRRRLADAIGEPAYLWLYSLLSIALLAWLIRAAVRAPFVPLWDLAPWHYHATIVLMLPASMLLIGGAFAPNPLSISFSRCPFDPARPGLVGITRHPLLWAFALWSSAHLIPNGDMVSLIMFGGFALFSLTGMAMVDRRRRTALGPEWGRLAARTSIIPFAALLSNRASPRWNALTLAVTIVGGTLLYLSLLGLHPIVIGVDPAAALG